MKLDQKLKEVLVNIIPTRNYAYSEQTAAAQYMLSGETLQRLELKKSGLDALELSEDIDPINAGIAAAELAQEWLKAIEASNLGPFTYVIFLRVIYFQKLAVDHYYAAIMVKCAAGNNVDDDTMRRYLELNADLLELYELAQRRSDFDAKDLTSVLNAIAKNDPWKTVDFVTAYIKQMEVSGYNIKALNIFRDIASQIQTPDPKPVKGEVLFSWAGDPIKAKEIDPNLQHYRTKGRGPRPLDKHGEPQTDIHGRPKKKYD